MKKIFTLAACALMASAAWAGVVTLDLNKSINPASLQFNDNGIWTECYNDVDYTWMEFGNDNGTFMLSHLIDGEGASWGGYYWDGFCPAIGGDITDYGQPGSGGTWTTNFGGCMAGGGCTLVDGKVVADPNQPYLVAYYSSWAMEGPSNQVMFVDKDGNTTFEPVGVYVCNHPWPYYGCLHGDGTGRAFEEGDYFELTAHGVAADGTETTTSINLVEFVDGQLNALNDWTFFDLSSLGEVESVYFTMNSTDSGAYGMNTAAYFCMDMFQVKGEGGDVPPTPPTPAEEVTLVIVDQDNVEHAFNLTKGEDGDFSTTVTLDYVPYGQFYWDPNLSYAENDANRPAVPFYFLIDGQRYGAEDMRATVLGFAMQNPLDSEADGFYTVPVGFSYTLGVAQRDGVNYVYAAVSTPTAVNELNANKTVAGVHYFNAMGQEMQEANGMTIVVTTYTDGTTSTVKVMK
jgi:hypothetical protein